MSSSLSLSFKEPGTALLEWDQPGSSVNLLSQKSIGEWEDILSRLEREPPKALVLISKKHSGFCSGADLRELQSLVSSERPASPAGESQSGAKKTAQTDQNLKAQLERAQKFLAGWDSLKVSKIAAIHGACLGGGLELALACDWRLAGDSPSLKIGLPEVRLGLIPGLGGCRRLPELIGLKAGLRLILSGKILRGKEALALGLIEGLAPRPALLEEALRLAREIARGEKPPRPPQKFRPKAGWTALAEGRLGRPFVFYLSKKALLKKSPCAGFLKAPLKALETVKKTSGGRGGQSRSKNRALVAETEAFCGLAKGRESQNLIRLFFLRKKAEALKETDCLLGRAVGRSRPLPAAPGRSRPFLNAGPEAEDLSAPEKRAGIIGAGLMGGGLAWLLADRGWTVRLKDSRPEALSAALKAASGLWRLREQKGELSRSGRLRRESRISPALDYSGFSTLSFVIEAVPEDMKLKKTVIREASALMNPQAVLASNTSSLSISELAEAAARPERFLGMHFFSPVHKMPLAEIIPAKAGAAGSGRTAEDSALKAAFQMARTLGKTPVMVRDRPGFAVNRLLAACLTEALWLLNEGNSLDLTDRLYERFGFPMGPFRLMDEIGLKTCAQVIGSLQRQGLDLEIPMAAESLPQTLGPGRHGRRPEARPGSSGKSRSQKTHSGGSGFYLYGSPNSRPQSSQIRRPNPEALRLQKKRMPSDPEALVERGVFRMINEGMKLLGEGAVDSADDLDLAMVLGMGFPPFLGGPMRYAESLGREAVRARLNSWSKSKGARFAPWKL